MAQPISPVNVLMGIAGAVILYGAVTNRNPIDVIKLTLQGQPLDKARPISHPGTGFGPGTIPGNQLPGTPGADGDARTDPPGFDPDTEGVIPRLPGEGVPPNGTL